MTNNEKNNRVDKFQDEFDQMEKRIQQAHSQMKQASTGFEEIWKTSQEELSEFKQDFHAKKKKNLS